ncbi:SAM-dependent methyltransferase [Gloeomargarita lithophora Alchichica-D10]|uniref:SAM-dependent methyltransferase n=1 Tax=Gloeomargarita lithophora Alchichica-D10 TaxID=1188229 RepID=A0A1J0AF07_9CYAN|nr:class I SAM-dependent methyltransferase [Gloeomargarita lithophora]APB34516.1 SAM-dependent methyltransferase [Gloeomargarita lithophora Alchichica-D10]
MTDTNAITQAVQNLYNVYPFPPEPLTDGAPPGYNWRWCVPAAHHFALGWVPHAWGELNILDAGCGTGVGTDYLAHLNPTAQVTGIDLSPAALGIAQERVARSGVAHRVTLQQLSLTDVPQLSQQYQYINCVGVLHHLPDPKAGLRALAGVLAPGGLMHIFVYALWGRWEIRRMQKAIACLQPPGDYPAGVAMGRRLFAHLPADNRLVRRERERWALDNIQDATFADMYVHPQEIDYTVQTLFELIADSGLAFLGFSNPRYWRLERLLAPLPELLQTAQGLPQQQQYELMEALDPELSHFELFLGRQPLAHFDGSEATLVQQATPVRSPCLMGWPGRSLLDYDYQAVDLTPVEQELLARCEGDLRVNEVLAQVPSATLEQVQDLQKRQLIWLKR